MAERNPVRTLIGHIGNNPERRETATGKVVTDFSLYVKEGRGEDAPTKRYTVSVWNGENDRAADIAHGSFKKGDRVMVFGPVKATSYERKDGQEVAGAPEVTAWELGPTTKFTGVNINRSRGAEQVASR